jgi:predicted ester cyclase
MKIADARRQQHDFMQNNSNIVRRFIEEVLNKGNIDSAGQFFWEDMVEQVPLPSQGPGLQGLKDVLRGLRAVFPDMHWSVEEQSDDGDKVLSRFEWTGTHRGEFLGVHRHGAARESLGHGHRPSAGRQNQGHPTYHGYARTDDAARCVSVGKSMMSPPPKHALYSFHIHSFPPGEIRPFPARKFAGKNTGKALTLRRHSDRRVRVCFPRLQREIQRSVRLLATE